MEKSHRVKSRHYMRCDWKEVDISDEKLQTRAVGRKKWWSLFFPCCPINLQCLRVWKKTSQIKNTHISTQWIAWGMSNWYSFELLAPYPYMVDWTKGNIIQTKKVPNLTYPVTIENLPLLRSLKYVVKRKKWKSKRKPKTPSMPLKWTKTLSQSLPVVTMMIKNLW